MVSIGCGAQVPVPEPVTDQETELGQEMYKELTNKGEIIESSPLYDTLKPIADSISRVAQSRYSSLQVLSDSRKPNQTPLRRPVAMSTSWILFCIS